MLWKHQPARPRTPHRVTLSLEVLESRTLLSVGVGVKGDIKDLTGLTTEVANRRGRVNGYALESPDGRFVTYDIGNKTAGRLRVATDSNDVWDRDGNTSPGQAALVDAQYYAAATDNFYQEVLGFDWTQGGEVRFQSVAHYGRDYTNAFYNGTYVVYGDGDGVTTRSLSGAVDVVAHELTHSVTDRTSGLIYQGESGALNEALSDIIGTAVEWYVGPEVGPEGTYDPDFYLGEDVFVAPGSHGIRNMANPEEFNHPSVYQGEFWADTSPGSFDYGGVHINSSVANHAYYQLAQRLGASSSDPDVAQTAVFDAARIFFKGFTEHLEPNATFSDARTATEQAAEDLGFAESVITDVSAAWDAVGVTGESTQTGDIDGGSGEGSTGLTASGEMGVPDFEVDLSSVADPDLVTPSDSAADPDMAQVDPEQMTDEVTEVSDFEIILFSIATPVFITPSAPAPSPVALANPAPTPSFQPGFIPGAMPANGSLLVANLPAAGLSGAGRRFELEVKPATEEAPATQQPDSKQDKSEKKQADPDKKQADPEKKQTEPDEKQTEPDKKQADPDKKPKAPEDAAEMSDAVFLGGLHLRSESEDSPAMLALLAPLLLSGHLCGQAVGTDRRERPVSLLN